MEKTFMKGGEAISEAAIRAGCRFFAGYPITPQNEVPEYFSRRMPEVNGVFIQGESEVASINMINGAAFGGTRSMTSSASCGISLKAEGVSVAAANHLPIVICNVQRAGPGVGPIVGSQQDYWLSTKAYGNGGFKLFVLAPESVQEAVDMTYEAFDIAEKYRNPVMLLVDGIQSIMMEPVVLPPMLSDEEIAAKKAKIKAEWGCGDSTGRTVKHPLNPKRAGGQMEMNRLDWEMYEGWKRDEPRWEDYFVDDAEVIIAAYGISARIAKSAIAILRREGVKVGMVRPKTVFPFPTEAYAKLDPAKVKFILNVEMSMPPQMIEDVQAAVQFNIPNELCLTSGGTIMGRDTIVEKVKELLNK